jgi:hypothetical protein
MKNLKKQLEEIFANIELDSETIKFIQDLEDKIEEVKNNNNNITASKETVESTIYNLNKIIPDYLKEDDNDN